MHPLGRELLANGSTIMTYRQLTDEQRVEIKDHRGQIPHRISIDERPEIVDQRNCIADWEIDTIIGENQ